MSIYVLVIEVKTYGKAIDGQKVVKKIMRSMTSRFDFVVVVIQEQNI